MHAGQSSVTSRCNLDSEKADNIREHQCHRGASKLVHFPRFPSAFVLPEPPLRLFNPVTSLRLSFTDGTTDPFLFLQFGPRRGHFT